MNNGNKPITVLLTGAGAPGMPGILTCLKRAPRELRLVGVDMDPNAPSRKDFDSFYMVPAAKEKSLYQQFWILQKKKKWILLFLV